MEEMKLEKTVAEVQTVKRLYELLDLQKEIEQTFGSENYNIFVFGSYITVYYVEGVSDVDVAVLQWMCENLKTYCKEHGLNSRYVDKNV